MSFGFKKRSFFIVVLFVLTFFVSIIEVNADVVSIERIAKWNSYVVGNGETAPYGVSTDGDYVVFYSSSSNLVDGDTNSKNDVFLYNNTNNTILRISVNSDGVQGNNDSNSPTISPDGRYISFHSNASNLVAGDTNARSDIFVYDRTLEVMERVSLSSLGAQGNDHSFLPSITPDGRYIAFQSDATNLVAGDTNAVSDVFLYDRTLDTIERVSLDDMGAEGDNSSDSPKISEDGLFITFVSTSTNLVADDTNGFAYDVFVRDLTLDTTERVSISTLGVEADGGSGVPGISSDGRYVNFQSDATSLVPGDTNGQTDVFVYDRNLNTIERVSISSLGEEGTGGYSSYSMMSSDGRYVTFESTTSDLVPGDTNGNADIFVYDRNLDTLERVSLTDEGVEGNINSNVAAISPDGNYVSFFSQATNFDEDYIVTVADVFIYNRTADTIEHVLAYRDRVEANDVSVYPSVSSLGLYVAFASPATNLVPDDSNLTYDIFVQNTTTGAIERVSVSSLGAEADGSSYYPAISSDGRYVAFYSSATNLVAGDANGTDDIFVYDRTLDTIERVSVSSLGVEGEYGSALPSISSDGRYVAFYSEASSLVPEDTGPTADIFVYDRTLDTIERVSVSSLGVEANDYSQSPTISADGRYIAFESGATNLVDGDTNARSDIFVYDRTLDTIERVSVSTLGVEGNGNSSTASISANGRYVVFESIATNLVDSDTNVKRDIFIHDRTLNTTNRVSVSTLGVEGDNHSYSPVVSVDGRYITYYSTATNLVLSDANAEIDVFLYDQDTDVTSRISVQENDTEANGGNNSATGFGELAISPNGLYVVFKSSATDLVLYDANSYPDLFFLTLDNTADAEDVVVEEEEVVETPRSTSGSTRTLRNSILNNNITPVIPGALNTPVSKDCIASYKFSPSTGLPCLNKFTFQNNLSLKMIHPDVKELQKYLNTHGYPVALSGAGSLGNETTKFGPLTKSALIKFQQAKNIIPAVGFFGPITRGLINNQ